MFKFLKNIFARNEAAAAVDTSNGIPKTVAAPAATAAPRVPKVAAGVEVASLSLRAILEKLPADLTPILNQLPDAEVKIVLPVSTILKQLAAGSVKMSLASLVRQAPPGTFRKAEIEEKRMVDVPLSEVFKTVNPSRLQRRADQRQYDVPDDATGLFGNAVAARSVAIPAACTAAPAPSAPAVDTAPVSAPDATKTEDPKVEPMKVLRMPGVAGGTSPVESQPSKPAPASASAPNAAAPAESARPIPTGELSLSFVEVASTWPEGIRSELSILPGDTKLVIPASALGAGLQKGKVEFPWSQVRVWIRPGFNATVAIPDDFSLVFPLKIVAPAFVAATGATKRKEGVVIDQSLPDFFGPTAKTGATAAAPASAPPSAPAAPSAPAPVPAPVPVAQTAPVAAGGLKLSIAEAPPAQPGPSATPTRQDPQTLGELFGQPSKDTWTPEELIARVCDLPGVAGAVVALEEGLVVAQRLPDGLAAETFAAFMPQFFGRVEGYVQEMKLGETNAITIHSTSGPCHLARKGKIFFAALGRPGEKLPTGLRLIPTELANHNH
jgi:predicted regulator of Ras-like GTPase activity (Roadblock/LC7/MglB family)